MERTVPSVVAMMAVRNRKDATVGCIRRLLAAEGPFVVERVVVVDDGSSDGTSEAASAISPKVQVFSGDGSLYWAGGMSWCEREALKLDPDFILWVNDDAIIHDAALERLLASQRRAGDAGAISVGTMVDPDDPERVTYSGLRRCAGPGVRLRRLDSAANKDRIVSTFNGNLVLIPASTVRALGGIDGGFTHHYADWDFGLRASDRGVPVVASAGIHGFTKRNQTHGTYRDPNLTRRQRFRAARGPKGLPPSEHARMLRRHGGLLWPVQWMWAYVGIALEVSIGRDNRA